MYLAWYMYKCTIEYLFLHLQQKMLEKVMKIEFTK
jgi:hypothetical protein